MSLVMVELGARRPLMRKVYANAGAAPASLKADFLVDWRDGFWVATNFTDDEQNVPAATGTRMIIGSPRVGPGGVTIWK